MKKWRPETIYKSYEYNFTVLSLIDLCYTENTIVVCSQTAENVAVISKPLTTAIHEILTG